MTLAIRMLLIVVAIVSFGIGGWAQFAPDGFYAYFPTVDLNAPYNEHFVRDYGGATLGLGVVLLAAAIWPQTRLVVVAAVAYLVFAVPHAMFHFTHLEHATAVHVSLLIAEMIASMVLPALVLVFAVVRMRRERRLRHPAVG